jgi:hypothetical protein
MSTPSKAQTGQLQGLHLLFSYIEDPKKVSKVKSMLKSNKSLATERLGGAENGQVALCKACASNNYEIVKTLVTTDNVDVRDCPALFPSLFSVNSL